MYIQYMPVNEIKVVGERKKQPVMSSMHVSHEHPRPSSSSPHDEYDVKHVHLVRFLAEIRPLVDVKVRNSRSTHGNQSQRQREGVDDR